MKVIRILTLLMVFLFLAVSISGFFYVQDVYGNIGSKASLTADRSVDIKPHAIRSDGIDSFSCIDHSCSDDLKDLEKPDEIDTYVVEEKNSPHDRIKPENIRIYQDMVTIEIKDAYLVAFTDTNSMDPLIDTESNALQIEPASQDDIHIGDIISYETSYSENRIIHRVIEIGEDEEGWYAKTKGDNLAYEDPEIVRFDSIKRVVIGILY